MSVDSNVERMGGAGRVLFTDDDFDLAFGPRPEVVSAEPDVVAEPEVVTEVPVVAVEAPMVQRKVEPARRLLGDRSEWTTTRRIWGGIAAGGLVTLLVVGPHVSTDGGIFGGHHASPDPTATAPATGGSGETSATGSAPTTAPIKTPQSPKQYDLDPISFGKANGGWRELGSYGMAATTLTFTLRDQLHTLDMPATKYHLYTNGENLKITITDDGVDADSNTTKKDVAISYDSFGYKATGPSVEAINKTFVIKGKLPAERLKEKGYPVCTPSTMFVGCPGTKVPSKYLVSAHEVNLYKDSAEILALQALQRIAAKFEDRANRKAIVLAYDGQAENAGVSPKLIHESIVDDSGKATSQVPNYVQSLINQWIARGGSKDAAKLFSPGTSKQLNKAVIYKVNKMKSAKG